MKIEKYILISLLFLALVNFLVFSFDILFYRFDIDFSEGFMFVALKNLDNRLPVYQNPNEYFFNIIKYPPLFFLISFPFYKLFGLSLLSLRIVSATFFLLTVIILFKFLICIKRDFISSTIFILFPIASTVVFWQTFQARPELVALFFSVLSIFLSYIYNLKKDEKIFFLALIFANFAFLTKQTFLAPILAIIIFYRRKFLQVVKFESIIIVGLIVLNIITDGNFFLQLTKFSLGLFLYRADMMNLIYIQYGLLFLFSLITIFLLKDKKYDLIKITFLISLILNFILLIRDGSWIYYLLEPIFYSSILLYIFFVKGKNPLVRYVLIVLFISILIWNVFDKKPLTYLFNRDSYPPNVNYQADLKIKNYIDKNNGNCYTENPSHLFMYDRIVPESWLLIELFRNNIVDEDDFNFINNYSCLIFYSRVFLFPNFNEVISTYELKERIVWTDINSNKLDVLVYER